MIPGVEHYPLFKEKPMAELGKQVKAMESFVDSMMEPINEKIEALKGSVQNQINAMSATCTQAIDKAKNDFERMSEQMKKLAEESKSIKEAALKDIKETGSVVKADVAKSQSDLIKKIDAVQKEHAEALALFTTDYIKKTDESIRNLSSELRSALPQISKISSKSKNYMQEMERIAHNYLIPDKE